MSKGHATPPAPQNRTRRAAYSIKRMPDPHAKAELLKLAIDQHQKEESRPKKSK